MSNNAPDYENDLVFPPRHDETAYELQLKVNKLEKQLKIAVETITALAIVGKYSIAIEALHQIEELDK